MDSSTRTLFNQKRPLMQHSSSQLISRIFKNIQRQGLLHHYDNVLVAISGGADSTALLSILKELPLDLNLTAVYVNHGLRPHETADEENFLFGFCHRLSVPLRIERVNVPDYAKKQKKSIEESARELRYNALHALRRQTASRVIAVAHTADDQVEEFFIRLIRGSGMKGLSGMDTQNGAVIRPLLNEKKSTLLSYLHSKQLTFCNDSSNQDRSFLRNRVRLDLLPFLERDFSASIRETTLQTMSVLKEEDHFLTNHCNKIFETLTHGESRTQAGDQNSFHLKRKPFGAEQSAIQRRLLERICWQLDCRPTYRTITDLQKFIYSGKNGATLHLQNGLRVTRNDDDVIMFDYPEGKGPRRGDGHHHISYSIDADHPGTYYIKETGVTVTIESVSVTLQEGVAEGGSLYIDEESVTFPLKIRSVSSGEKIKLLGALGAKKIRRIFTDLKIPKNQREQIPILSDSAGAIAIIGIRIADRVKLTPATRKALRITLH